MSRSGPCLDREGQEGHQNYPIVFNMAFCFTLWIRTILDSIFLFISTLNLLRAVEEIYQKETSSVPEYFFLLFYGGN